MINYPDKLNIIFDKLKSHNIKPIIVGGFIRDFLLHIDSKDIDIEVYGISSFTQLQNLLKEFGSVNVVGKSFGVCKLYFEDYDLDFSFPRRDNKIKRGHKGFEIEIDTTLDFKTAASRRDFTINSMGYDVTLKKILDPFNGLSDLKHKILRAVDTNSFSEDPLRVLRAVQFSTRFQLKIDSNLFATCKDMVLNNMLEELPKERIFEEIKKLLLYSKEPSKGFRLLKELGSDIYTNNIHVVDKISKQLTSDEQTNLALMLAALCHDFSQETTAKFIRKLTNENRLLQHVLLLVENSKEIDKIYLEGITDYTLFKLATKVKIEEILILSSSIYFSKNNSSVYEAYNIIYKRAKELNILNKKSPMILKGKDLLKLGFTASPEFSDILNSAYEAQMMGKFKTNKDAIIWLKSKKSIVK